VFADKYVTGATHLGRKRLWQASSIFKLITPPIPSAPSSTFFAYNLGNFFRTLGLPKAAEPWSLISLREKLIKIGAKVVSHGRYVTFQMAEVAVPRQMSADILMLIARLRAPPAPA
jgi:hypothetical protein